MRRPFNTECDIYAGPSTLTPGAFRGTYPCRLIPQSPIGTVGLGSVPLAHWLTIDGYQPRGAWTSHGFGMDAGLSDQVTLPSGGLRRFWVLYSDKVIYGALTPYYRAYLADLPLPPANVPQISEFVVFRTFDTVMPKLAVTTKEHIVIPQVKFRVRTLRSGLLLATPAITSPRILARGAVNRSPTAKFVNRTTFARSIFRNAGRTGNAVFFCSVALPAKVEQFCSGSVVGTAGIPCNWGATTKAGSLLIGVATQSTISAGSSSPTWTWPSGWTQRGSYQTTNGAQGAAFSVASYPSAPSFSIGTTVTATSNWAAGSPNPNVGHLELIELSNLPFGGTLEFTQVNNGTTGTTLTTGTASAPTHSNDYVLAVFVKQTGLALATYSAPTNGFNIQVQGGTQFGSFCISDQFWPTMASVSTGVTCTQNLSLWAAGILEFS